MCSIFLTVKLPKDTPLARSSRPEDMFLQRTLLLILQIHFSLPDTSDSKIGFWTVLVLYFGVNFKVPLHWEVWMTLVTES